MTTTVYLMVFGVSIKDVNKILTLTESGSIRRDDVIALIFKDTVGNVHHRIVPEINETRISPIVYKYKSNTVNFTSLTGEETINNILSATFEARQDCYIKMQTRDEIFTAGLVCKDDVEFPPIEKEIVPVVPVEDPAIPPGGEVPTLGDYGIILCAVLLCCAVWQQFKKLREKQ